MKKKDLKELKEVKKGELEKKISDYKKEILSTKADMAAGKKLNPKKVKMLRRDLAQTLTIMRQMEIIEGEKK